jgi:hypothetical protein
VNRLLGQLGGFQAAIMSPPAAGPLLPATVSELSAFICGIERKIRFVELHLAVLAGVRWDRVESIGRRVPGGAQPNHLTIPLAEASLTIEHADAVIDHVYVSFDGLTAAVVNMTDTMGRLINLRYAVGVDPRKASLLSLKNHCAATSPLAGVVNDSKHNDWLKKVRDLRGRCQHADVEHVVVAIESSYARRGQPVIPSHYDWQTPPRALPILDYAQAAVLAAEDTVLAVITAVLAAPANPLI